MTKTLMQPLAAETARRSRHFQLIVDIHLLLVSDGDLLLGRRANTGYGDGAYEPPSGRLAERETLVEAAVRVAAAQTGVALEPAQVSLAHVLHDVSGAGRMAFFLTADGWSGEASLLPAANGTCSYSDFGWYPLTELPANMIDRARVAVRNYAAGGSFSTYPAFGMLTGGGGRLEPDDAGEDPRVTQRDLRARRGPVGVGLRRRAARVRPPGLRPLVVDRRQRRDLPVRRGRC
ncbi:MAG TPA: NUDIX domain-containing protein [Trebonia sp.]|jgi:ADP-ribose pyrophosphatase YjhB (NUDIX family)|nr:NUDIX domain-containing protein [Trebonia sp.]